MKRYYLNTLRPAWPVSRQESLLDDRFPNWREGQEYRDELPPRRRQTPSPDDLLDRASMLRPTSRRSAEQIVVASIAVLAVSQLDLVRVLAMAEARKATLIAIAEEVRLVPPYTAEAIAETLTIFAMAIHRGRGNTRLGHLVSAERREARAKAACDLIKERWALPRSQFSDKALLAEAGVARATAVRHLGDRTALLKKIEADANREAANQRRRKPNASDT